MKSRLVLTIAVTLIAISMVASVGIGVLARENGTNVVPKMSALKFHDDMRKLWEDHITWTRLAIVDLAAGAPETNATVARLLANQVDIGNAIRPIYGNAAGDKLTDLLTTHIVQAANIIVDAKAGDNAGVQENLTAWYDNANQIASFLSSANPVNWPLATMQALMKMHLDLTLKEATAQLTGDYALSVSTYEEVHHEILDMADVLSGGIMAQFPGMFNGVGAFMR